jgi:hypothetical protein
MIDFDDFDLFPSPSTKIRKFKIESGVELVETYLDDKIKVVYEIIEFEVMIGDVHHKIISRVRKHPSRQFWVVYMAGYSNWVVTGKRLLRDENGVEVEGEEVEVKSFYKEPHLVELGAGGIIFKLYAIKEHSTLFEIDINHPFVELYPSGIDQFISSMKSDCWDITEIPEINNFQAKCIKKLSERDAKILQKWKEEYTAKEIGHEFKLSPGRVLNIIGNLRKLYPEEKVPYHRG